MQKFLFRKKRGGAGIKQESADAGDKKKAPADAGTVLRF